MPAETAPHERTWIAWPSAGYTLGDSEIDVQEARGSWAAVANAAAEFEPVSMVVTAEDLEVARQMLAPGVEFHVTELDDAWMRDMGPTFVVRSDGGVDGGKGRDGRGGGDRLGAVDWVFNGWGAQAWASWGDDARVGSFVAGLAGVKGDSLVASSLVNEGGGIHVDGLGTVLVTETVQLDPGRNPSATKESVEAELARTIGATQVIWLPRGLTRDYDEFGTRGHVDIVATIPSPAVVLVHDQEDPSHPDHAVSQEIIEVLSSAVDAKGVPFEVVRLPAPVVGHDEGGPVDWSYVNHLVVNGGVIACTFGDEQDDRALSVLAQAYPGRKVVGVDARPLFARGGGIHCITQQQPAV